MAVPQLEAMRGSCLNVQKELCTALPHVPCVGKQAYSTMLKVPPLPSLSPSPPRHLFPFLSLLSLPPPSSLPLSPSVL